MKSPLLIAAVALPALSVAVWIYLQTRSQPIAARVEPVEPPRASAESESVAVVTAAVPTNTSVIIASAQPVTSVDNEPSTQAAFAASMHALEQTNPARALEMARQGREKWPTSERAAEFAATEVKCLYLLGRPSEGRGAAEAMVNKYTNTPWAIEVERQTGAHPYVNH